MTEKLFMGIDVGTQGTRVIIADDSGRKLAETARDFSPFTAKVGLPNGWFQQSPRIWWEATRNAIAQSISELNRAGRKAVDIYALSVTSTSGTIIALDQNMEPLNDAIMYNDNRAGAEAEQANRVAQDLTDKLGYKFSASFGLPKMLWIKGKQPDIFDRTRIFAHASDFISGKISGEYGVTDYTNALKSGYDIELFQWPEFIETRLKIPFSKLQKVFPSGRTFANVSKQCALETGLAESTLVATGMTDGCASQVASGAVVPGSWNTTIGTTLVVKGVTLKLVPDPEGRIYSHRHPEGYWMPGGASNTGGDCLELNFSREEFDNLNKGIAGKKPSSLIIFPLQKKEERFPIKKSGISGFILGEPRDRYELYQGYLEGVGYVERYTYELLGQLGAEVGDKIYVAGGAAKSLEWLKIRANIMNKVLEKPEITGAHMGAAVLAASRTYYHSLAEATEAMVKLERQIEPEPEMAALYQEKYEQFIAELTKRNYINKG